MGATLSFQSFLPPHPTYNRTEYIEITQIWAVMWVQLFQVWIHSFGYCNALNRYCWYSCRTNYGKHLSPSVAGRVRWEKLGMEWSGGLHFDNCNCLLFAFLPFQFPAILGTSPPPSPNMSAPRKQMETLRRECHVGRVTTVQKFQLKTLMSLYLCTSSGIPCNLNEKV